MSRWVLSLMGIVLLGSLLIFVVSASAGGLDAASFYKNKAIDLTCVNAPGASADIFARMSQPFIQKYTGAGAVIVANRRGAGGLEGYNFVYRAEANGLHIGIGTRTAIPLNEIMDEPGVAYDATKYLYLLGVERSRNILSVKTAGRYNSLADLKAGKNLKLAATSPAGNLAMAGVTAIYALGLDAKVVSGFKGPTECGVALLQGEIDAWACPAESALSLFKGGQIKGLCILAPERDKAFPNIPTITELISLQGDRKEVIELWGPLVQGRIFFAPPGMPGDRVEFLRKAFSDVAKDPGFAAGVEKLFGYKGIDVDTGEQVLKEMKFLIDRKTRFKALFEDLFNRYRA